MTLPDLRASLALSLVGLLAGVAVAGPELPVAMPGVGPSDLVSLPIREITGPIALVVTGGMAGRLLTQVAAALRGWRPHIVVEHRHVRAAPGAGGGGEG
jgi:hypothetical protein